MMGLDKIDRDILKILKNGASYTTKIASNLGILRTTTSYRLKRMFGLKLVKKQTIGRKTFWSINVKKKGDAHNQYMFFEGSEVFLESFYNILNLPKDTTILVIQGSAAAENDIKVFPPSFLKEAHRVFKGKRIILKGIVNREILKTFDSLNNEMTESHSNRIQSMKIFDDSKFLSSGEIMSTENLLLLSNPKKQIAVVIKDNDITKIFNDSIKLIFELSENTKTFNINQYLKNKILK